MLNKSNLYNYQLQTIEFAKKNKKCGLFLSLGAGKTISTLTLLAEVTPGSTLIIAPIRVARTVWIQEAAKWQHTKHLEFVQLAGLSPKKRLAALQEGFGKICIINVELIQWLFSVLDVNPFDTIIIDEFSQFKNPNTKRFKAVKKLFRQSDRVIGLTATPAPNSLINLWSQLYLLDEGKRLSPYITHYREKYFTQSPYSEYVWELKPGSEKKIHNTISDICISLDAGDFIELPNIVYNDIRVELSVADRNLYNEMKNNEIIYFKELNKVVTAVNAAVLAGKLLQLASGTLYSVDKTVINIHDKKLDAVIELVEQLVGNPVIIAYKYVCDLEKLRIAFPGAPIMGKYPEGDELLCQRWNNGELPIMLLSPASASHGLNLQYGGHNIIEYTPDWSYERTDQFYGRLARQGQLQKRVFIHRLIVNDSFDERVIQVLKDKARGQNALLDAVKIEIT